MNTIQTPDVTFHARGTRLHFLLKV